MVPPGTGERVIDLRSDTLTQPTAGDAAAIAEAVVGDEQKREDPTVISLEERAAALLGQDAAVFVPTATMGEPDRAADADGARGRADRRRSGRTSSATSSVGPRSIPGSS